MTGKAAHASTGTHPCACSAAASTPAIDNEECWQQRRENHDPGPLPFAPDSSGLQQPDSERFATVVENDGEAEPHQPSERSAGRQRAQRANHLVFHRVHALPHGGNSGTGTLDDNAMFAPAAWGEKDKLFNQL